MMLSNAVMTTIAEIHRANLDLLVQEVGGTNAALAKRLGRSDSQLTQWRKGSLNSGTGKARGLRPASCRMIERAMGKPEGWMDKVHDDKEREVEELVSIYLSLDSRDRATAITVLRGLAENAVRSPE